MATIAKPHTLTFPLDAGQVEDIDGMFGDLYRGLRTTAAAASATSGAIDLETGVTGVLPEVNGGTNQSTYATGDLLYASAANTLAKLAASATATRYLANTGAANIPAWDRINLADGVTGTLPETKGGTGQATYATGDLLYASAANTLAKLAASVTATRYLANTGVGNIPAWNQVNLANGVTGNLPVANLNGGSGATSSTFWRGDGQWGLVSGSGGESLDIANKRVAWLMSLAGSAAGYGVAGCTSSVFGTSSSNNDSTDTGYISHATTASVNVTSGVNTGAGVTRLDWNPTIIFYVKTGASIANLRIWCGLRDSAQIGAGTDTMTGKYCGFRFSSAAPDGGWVGQNQTATGAGNFSVTGTVATIAINTVYKLKMVVTGGGANVAFSVNDGVAVNLSTNIPTGTALFLLAGVVTNENVAKQLNVSRAYVVTS